MDQLGALEDGASVVAALKPAKEDVLPPIPPPAQFKRLPLHETLNPNKEIPSEVVGILIEAISDTGDTFLKQASTYRRRNEWPSPCCSLHLHARSLARCLDDDNDNSWLSAHDLGRIRHISACTDGYRVVFVLVEFLSFLGSSVGQLLGEGCTRGCT